MTPSYSFSEAIKLHRQLASVEMQDNVDGLVFIDAQLDHTTKKKVNLFLLEEICLSYLQFLSRGRSGVLKSGDRIPESEPPKGSPWTACIKVKIKSPWTPKVQKFCPENKHFSYELHHYSTIITFVTL